MQKLVEDWLKLETIWFLTLEKLFLVGRSGNVDEQKQKAARRHPVTSL